MRIPTVALIAGLSFVACRSSGGDDTNGIDSGSNGGGDGGSNSGGGTKIQDIQNTASANYVKPGTAVTLSGVVVTAIDGQSSQKGNFWVEEPEGGEYSGVLVHGGTLTDVAALTVGDIVTVSGGVTAEFFLNTDTSGNTDTEVEPAAKGDLLTIKKTGHGSVPAPVPVDALMIGSLSTQAQCDAAPTTCATNVAWEPYEGVLIKVTTTDGGVIAGGVSSGSDATKLHFNLTGQIDVESTLVDFPAGLTSGECLASVTGVLDYFFQYNLLPTQASDIATGGAGCPAREQGSGTSPGTCQDQKDNDGNGFTDCLDLGCEVGSNAWLGATCGSGDTTCGCSTNTTAGAGVSTANGETTSTPLVIRAPVVTAIGTSGYWIADSGIAAANHGIFVFSSATGLSQGENLATVQGLAGPFGNGSGSGALKVSEINDATTVAGVGTATLVPLTGQSAATLTALAGGAQFAGVLVSLTAIKVTALADSHNQVKVVDKAGTAFTMDDEAFGGYGSGSSVPAVGDCYTTLTGVMDLQTNSQLRTINPRGATDMVKGAASACN